MSPPPPLIRRRDVLKMFQGKVDARELRVWVSTGIVETFQRTPKARRYYITAGIERLINPPR